MERQTCRRQKLSQIPKPKNPPRTNNRRQKRLKNIEEASRMARLKVKTLREMNDQDLGDKLAELKTDLGKLQLEKSKGTLKKQTGSIRWLRRDIARKNTIFIRKDSLVRQVAKRAAKRLQLQTRSCACFISGSALIGRPEDRISRLNNG